MKQGNRGCMHLVSCKLEERERHPITSSEKHVLYPIEINDVAPDTKDKDSILESELFFMLGRHF
ncbi:unnamed protein product [Musa acuminata subsp. malaccensis]|uniref:(wild Malaysian banana) hypothetical protein n=1 Tax=Musa acuminata subsp. malaccensis TaxID=214687 RepID=A0A804HM34_MUSAM|nr:unnamed protein product [Musa acuminata subsp. malaccensis]